MDEDLSFFGGCGFADLDCISPLAVAILLVNEDMAQPAHPALSLCGVPMRGTVPFTDVAAGGAMTVSGSEFPYLRIR